MLNSAREMPFFLDKSWQVWAANRRPPKADQRAISTSSRPARVRRSPASGEEARPMRLRTPAIRRDRPTGEHANPWGLVPFRVDSRLTGRGWAGAEAGVAWEAGGGAGARRDHGDRGRAPRAWRGGWPGGP